MKYKHASLPVGWYDVNDEEGNDSKILVFEDQVNSYKDLKRDMDYFVNNPKLGADDVMKGYFTADSNGGAKISETTVAVGKEKTSYLWLEGNLERDVTGTITSGTCEVTIRGGK